MKKIILGLFIIYISTIGALNLSAGVLKTKGSLEVTSNYVLYGKTLSQENPSLLSKINVNLYGVFASVHANGVEINDEKNLQTWFITGYKYNIDKSYVKFDYVKDYYIKNSSELNGDYFEFFVNLDNPKLVNIKIYNLIDIDNKRLSVESITLYKVIGKFKVQSTIGDNIDELYYISPKISYKIDDSKKVYVQYTYSNYNNSPKTNNYLYAGMIFSF